MRDKSDPLERGIEAVKSGCYSTAEFSFDEVVRRNNSPINWLHLGYTLYKNNKVLLI